MSDGRLLAWCALLFWLIGLTQVGDGHVGGFAISMGALYAYVAMCCAAPLQGRA